MPCIVILEVHVSEGVQKGRRSRHAPACNILPRTSSRSRSKREMLQTARCKFPGRRLVLEPSLRIESRRIRTKMPYFVVGSLSIDEDHRSFGNQSSLEWDVRSCFSRETHCGDGVVSSSFFYDGLQFISLRFVEMLYLNRLTLT